MNINAERFFALTALLAAPLVAAPACVINDSDDDTSNSSTNANTDSTNPSTTDMTGTDTVDPSATTMSGTDATTVGTGDTTGDDPSMGTDDPTGDTTDGTTGGNELGNCCAPDGATAGCEVPEVQDCVCEADPYCCDEVWDESCAGEVVSLGCGECNFPPQPFDCYCLAECDGKAPPGPWQVCGSDPVSAAVDGQAACEAEVSMGCDVFSCDECECFTAEVPEIDCK